MMQVASQRFGLICLVLLIAALVIQFRSLRSNPPGFFIDEASIAYNAYTIATTSRDEHGETWPLFFRAFGEYKNPVYIYLLAVLFRLSGPGILAARGLSALAGLATLVTLSLLAFAIGRTRAVALVIAILALLTPWLFELSRLAMEVAIYPLVVAIFLLAVWRAAQRPVWQASDICLLTLSLAALTYSYSIGRLLGPLLAFGLIIFLTRTRRLNIIITWIGYAVTLIPLVIFNQRHPGALTERFKFVTYLSPQGSLFDTSREFLRHFFSNLKPWRLFVSESSRVNDIVHIPGPPTMLTITVAFILGSLFLLTRRRQLNAWWSFLIFGALVSIVPASLTTDDFHMLRLAPLPVFLLVLTIPALEWLMKNDYAAKRIVLVMSLALITVQGFFFQWHYHENGRSPQRQQIFAAAYPTLILPTALATSESQPIYIADNSARPAYIQAFWYATLQGIPLNRFVSLGFDKSPPEDGVVISTEDRCTRCRMLAQSEPYTTYIAQGPPPALSRLSDDEMRAELSVSAPPVTLRPGERVTIDVSVKNVSKAVWRASDRSGSPYQVSVGNHWLDSNGQTLIKDDGRTSLFTDLLPGQTMQIPLVINAPLQSAQFQLEIDLLQEGVSWFGLQGSHSWRGKVSVAD